MTTNFRSAVMWPASDETGATRGGAEPPHEWQLAGERMLLYLKTMALSPEEQLGLSLEALRRARSMRPESAEPVAAAMEALWQILEERCLRLDDEKAVGRHIGPQRRLFCEGRQAVARLAHPAMRRQCMLAAPMELAPWRRTISNTIGAVRGPAEGWLYRKGGLFGGLLMLLALIALKF